MACGFSGQSPEYIIPQYAPPPHPPPALCGCPGLSLSPAAEREGVAACRADLMGRWDGPARLGHDASLDGRAVWWLRGRGQSHLLRGPTQPGLPRPQPGCSPATMVKVLFTSVPYEVGLLAETKKKKKKKSFTHLSHAPII